MRRLLPDPAELDDAGLVDAYRVPAGRHLRVNFIASLDGAVTVDGRSGGLGSPGDRRIFNVLRALADVVLVGHGTASAEGYGPMHRGLRRRPAAGVARPAGDRADRRRLQAGVARPGEPAGHRRGRPRRSWSPARRPTPDGGRRWPPPAWSCWSAGTTTSTCRSPSTGWPSSGTSRCCARAARRCSATPLAAGVVDELDLSIAPALVGGEHRLLQGLPGVVRLDLRQLLEEDGVLFTRYAVEPPGPGSRRPARGPARPASPRRSAARSSRSS